MVLMKQDERRQFLALKAQCGQERDLQVKQVENGYVIQSVIRFFIDQGEGPVSAGEVSDTTVAVSAMEAGLIAKNFMQYGEFWPDGIPAEIDVPEDYHDEPVEPDTPDPVLDRDHVDAEIDRAFGTDRPKPFYSGEVPPALPIAGKDTYPAPPPLDPPAIDPPRPVGRMTEDSHYPQVEQP